MADKKDKKKSGATAERPKEDIGTKIFNGLTTMAAAFVTRKLVTLAWTKATGKEPPGNPEDPRVDLVEALSWSMLTGVTIAAARVLAIRAVTRRTLGADRELGTAAKG